MFDIQSSIKHFARCIGNLQRIESVLEKLQLTQADGYTDEYSCRVVINVEDFSNLPKVGKYEKHFDNRSGEFSMRGDVDGVRVEFRTKNTPSTTCKVEWEETEELIPAYLSKRRVAKVVGCGSWTK